MNHLSITKIVFTLMLCSAFNTHADFRKALVHLQQTEGAPMLVEVETAVKHKNNDGLSLFLNTLSARFENGEFFITNRNPNMPYYKAEAFTQTLLLAKNNIPELVSLLKKATANADIETQASFMLLESKVRTGHLNGRLSRQQLEKLSSEGLDSASLTLDERRLKTLAKMANRDLNREFEFIKKSAESGNTNNFARLAHIYLHWHSEYSLPEVKDYFDVVPENPSKGMYWLKRYATNAYFADPFSACRLAKEYHSGKLIKKDDRQAYLWYIEAMKANFAFEFIENCAINGLKEMERAGDLKKVDNTLNKLITKKNHQIETYVSELTSNTQLPSDLIAEHSISNINKVKQYRHIYSIRPLKASKINHLVYSFADRRYSLEVYRDGDIKFRGNRGYNHNNHRDSSYISGKEEWKTKPADVSKFLDELEAAGIFESKSYYPYGALCGSGPAPGSGFIKVIKNNKTKSIRFHKEGYAFSGVLAKIFKAQETLAPTQHLRCGLARDDEGYQNCIKADEISFKNAQ